MVEKNLQNIRKIKYSECKCSKIKKILFLFLNGVLKRQDKYIVFFLIFKKLLRNCAQFKLLEYLIYKLINKNNI